LFPKTPDAIAQAHKTEIGPEVFGIARWTGADPESRQYPFRLFAH
jgi:hypothetical protein